MLGNAEGVGAPCSGFKNSNSGTCDAEGKEVEVAGVQAGRTVVPKDSKLGETVACFQLGRVEHKLKV